MCLTFQPAQTARVRSCARLSPFHAVRQIAELVVLRASAELTVHSQCIWTRRDSCEHMCAVCPNGTFCAVSPDCCAYNFALYWLCTRCGLVGLDFLTVVGSGMSKAYIQPGVAHNTLSKGWSVQRQHMSLVSSDILSLCEPSLLLCLHCRCHPSKGYTTNFFLPCCCQVALLVAGL